MGLLGNFVYQPNENHEVSLRVLGTQSNEDEARFQVEHISPSTVEQNQTLHYSERNLLSNQLHGFHKLGGGGSDTRREIDWTAAKNRTEQLEPDIRFFRSQYDLLTFGGLMPPNSTEAQNTRRIWRNVDEDSTLGQVDAKFPSPASRAGRASSRRGSTPRAPTAATIRTPTPTCFRPSPVCSTIRAGRRTSPTRVSRGTTPTISGRTCS